MKTSPFNKIFTDNIMVPLEALDGVSVMDGFLVHYADDLIKGRRGITFPCVAAQPGVDEVGQTGGTGVKGKMERKVRIIGAVSTADRSKVNEQINNLIYSVRCALATDRFKLVGASEIIIGGAKYDLPEAGDQYAYFDMEVTVVYVEQWS